MVIGTFNGERTLRAALDALENQVTGFSYETLVVNDASTDSTAEIASGPSVRRIDLVVNQGHGHALNVALSEARGEFLAMLDDDCVPPRDWLQQLGRAWQGVDSTVTMIGGLVEPYETDTFNRRYVAFRRPLRHQESAIDQGAGFWRRLRYQFSPPKMSAEPRSVFFTVGANMSVRVEAAIRAGGFTEARGAGEEESLARPLRSMFGPNTVRLFPEIVMRHNFQPSFRDTLRRSRSYGRASGREWVLNGNLPSLSPLVPIAVLTSGVVAIASPLAAVAVLVLSPYVLYRRWFAWMKSDGSRGAVIYPFCQAGEDIANNIGFVQGVTRELTRRRRSGAESVNDSVN